MCKDVILVPAGFGLMVLTCYKELNNVTATGTISGRPYDICSVLPSIF